MRVIITGAASGIGRACAELLAAGSMIPGEHRMLLADRDAANLQVVADAGLPTGPRLTGMKKELYELTGGKEVSHGGRHRNVAPSQVNPPPSPRFPCPLLPPPSGRRWSKARGTRG